VLVFILLLHECQILAASCLISLFYLFITMSSLSFVLFQKSQVEHFKKMDWILLRSACLKAISFTVILWSDWHSMQAGKILEHLCP